MARWGLLGRRTVTKTARSSRRKQGDSLRLRNHRGLRIEQFEERALLSIGTWMPLGPAPIDYGQTENVAPKSPSGNYLNEVTGAVQAVVAHPTNPDILYIGTANGGIWRTSNATAASPTWTPLTDNANSLSIGALALDSTDPNGMTLVAGEGRSSTSARTGGALDGLLYSDDGGATWTQLDGGGTLVGKICSGITLNGKTIVVAVDNAQTGSYSDVGIFRSTDGGKDLHPDFQRKRHPSRPAGRHHLRSCRRSGQSQHPLYCRRRRRWFRRSQRNLQVRPTPARPGPR